MDGQGRALDNVIIERLWSSVKYDEVYLNPYVSVWAAEAGLNRYLKHNNEKQSVLPQLAGTHQQKPTLRLYLKLYANNTYRPK